MPSFSRLRFERGGAAYEFDLDWDDAAFADGAIRFEVRARRRTLPDGEVLEHTVSLSIERVRDGEMPVLLVSADGKDIFAFELADLVDEAEVLEKIPSVVFGGDPIVGCLIRSGVSAVVGQLIHCKNDTVDERWTIPRVRAIGQCLRRNIPGMTARAAFRAARCVVRAGF